MLPKAIQELFDPEGRMNATLGVELPFTGALIQTTIPLGFVDPTTETIGPDETQIWKITHNGVDTHGIHFHLFNVQVINRVGWDGAIRPPDPNELGWKDTVRMNPLEDIIVAMRAKVPTYPFAVPNSIRPLNPAMPVGSTFASLDPLTGQPITVTNVMTNFGHEYTWHCHILGHEENDMMRPFVLSPSAKAEILWRNTTNGSNSAWLMDGTTVNTIVNLPALPNAAYTIMGTGDFNRDGKADILWRNTTTGANAVWLMDGTTLLSVADLPALPNTAYTIGGVGDFNGDGKPDILWRNTTTGQNAVWYMNGTALLSVADLPAFPNTAYSIGGVLDMNSDGKPDIIWRNPTTGANAVWYLNGVTLSGVADLPPEADSTWHIVGTGDLNYDAKPDLLWRNLGPGPNAGQNRVWYMDGASLLGTAALPPVMDLTWTIAAR